MKKLIFLALILALCFWLSEFGSIGNSWGYYGQFGTGTGARDSVYMNVSVFDTLGQQVNADTVVFTRWYGGTLIDSTILTGVGTRPGYYVTQKIAYDGTHIGSYNVDIRWSVNGGKKFHKSESYTVFPDSVNKVGTVRGNVDGSVASVTGAVGSVTGNVGGNVVGSVASVTGNVGGSVASVTADVGITQAGADKVWGTTTRALTDKAGFSLAASQFIEFWNVAFGSGFTAGSMGDSLNNPSYVQGSASGDWTSGEKNQFRWALGIDGARTIPTGYTTSNWGRDSTYLAHVKQIVDDSLADTSSVARSTWNNDIVAQANRRIQYVDSLGEEISGVADWTSGEKNQFRYALGIDGDKDTLNDSSCVKDIYNVTDQFTFTGSNVNSDPQDKSGFSLTTDYLTKADTGSTGASYLRTKYVEDKAGYSLASAQFIEFWNVAFGSGFTAGSMGDSLNNPSYVQGSASGDWTSGEKEQFRFALGINGTRDTVINDTCYLKRIRDKTDNLPTDPADDSDIDNQLATIQTDLDNPDQYKADVSNLDIAVSTRLAKSDSGSTGASYLRTRYLEDKTGITVSTNQDKTGYALTTDYLTKADTGSTGASYLRVKYVEDKSDYTLASSEKNFDNFTGTLGNSQLEANVFASSNFASSYWALTNWTGSWSASQYGNKDIFTDTTFTAEYWHDIAIYSDSGNVGGAATDWTTSEKNQIRRVLGVDGDTSTQASYGFLDAKISTRSTLTSSDNIGLNWANIINQTAAVTLSGTNISTGQIVARADSVTGVGRVSTNLDKTEYQLASGQIVARADSVTGVARISTNLDKNGY